MASNIVTYLRRERRKWGLTQEDLAHLVGLKSRASISLIEHGQRPPTAKELLAFQALFGMTALQLFPQLSVTTGQQVFRNAKVMIEKHETDSTLRAQRKNILLRQTLSRAVMS
jgi:transcriptional regulator with XRE-family HTH domain